MGVRVWNTPVKLFLSRHNHFRESLFFREAARFILLIFSNKAVKDKTSSTMVIPKISAIKPNRRVIGVRISL